MASTALTLGKFLITITNLGQTVGTFIFDFNETHVKNPHWPPHARFHNGQTMSLGLVLSGFSWYLMFREKSSVLQAKDDMMLAVIVSTMYFGAGLTAILYPGTKWTDPEFGQDSPQRYLFSGFLASAWIGWGIELFRLSGLKEGGKIL